MIPTDLPYIAGLTLLAVVLFYWMGLTFLTLAVALMEKNAQGFIEALGIGLRELPFAMSWSLIFMVMWTVDSFIEAYREERERWDAIVLGETK